MLVRYWYCWKGKEKEYIDEEEDDSLSKDEIEEIAQRNAEELAQVEGWAEYLEGHREDEETI